MTLGLRMKPLIAAILLLTCAISKGATSAQDVLDECSKNNDHPRTSACVALRAKNSSIELTRVESMVSEAIAALPKDQSNLKAIRSKFESSSLIFKRYRVAQCRSREEFAAMSMYSAEIGLACEIELNSKRIDELNVGLEWLK